ncbi:MAG: N-acetylmuramoyl-L-alanine amidase [Ignavibacteriae bacterium]|nr:N-acetylmuramoyl-L-alanine amidase [Ignavibacteriota bacterium]
MNKSIIFHRYFNFLRELLLRVWSFLRVILIIIVVFTSELRAALPEANSSTPFSVVLPSEKVNQISLRTVNSRSYASLAQLSRAAFPGSICTPSRNEIAFKTEKIRFAPSSFMVLRENSEGSRVAQMNLPAITMDGELFIPAMQFFPTLETLGLFKVTLGQSKVVLRMFGQTPPSAALIDAPVFFEPRSTTIDTRIPKVIPGRYSLPPDLKVRKEAVVKKSPEETENNDVSENNEQTITKTISYNVNNSEQTAITASAGVITETEFTSDNTVTRITSLLASNKSSENTEILFRSNVPLTEFQKPEIQGNEVTIRFPNVANGVSSFNEIEQVFPCSEVRSETGKNTVAFHFSLKVEPISCSVRRVDERGIALSIEYPSSELSENANAEYVKKRWDLDVIVLDAGHGGQDAGAISINGYKEKDITLAIAKKTKEFLKEYLPTTKVMMTRSDDTFIELERRTQIANKSGGKLFLSIHCNSMPTKPNPAHGFESYILRPGRNADAVRVADRENSVIKLEKRKDKYQELSEEKLIVATMAQSSFVKFSEQFASTVQDEVGKSITLHNRGVNQAGFYVLVGSSMPNVLFETAFLSNTEDEKFITSEKGQEKIAEGIAKAIKRYASEYAARLQKSK